MTPFEILNELIWVECTWRGKVLEFGFAPIPRGTSDDLNTISRCIGLVQHEIANLRMLQDPGLPPGYTPEDPKLSEARVNEIIHSMRLILIRYIRKVRVKGSSDEFDCKFTLDREEEKGQTFLITRFEGWDGKAYAHLIADYANEARMLLVSLQRSNGPSAEFIK